MIRLQLLETTVKTSEAALARRRVIGSNEMARTTIEDRPRFIQASVTARAPEVLQQHEPGNDVAVTCRRPRRNGAALLQRAGNAIEGFVSQLVRGRTVTPIEVGHQPPVHLEITLAARLSTVVQPGK